MLLELYPFQTELFSIARPRVRSEAIFCRFLRFWCVLGGPVGAFLVQIVVNYTSVDPKYILRAYL